MTGKDQEIHVIDLSRFTPLDVLYMIRDLFGWISLVKALINLIIGVRRLLSSCIVGYFGNLYITYIEGKTAELLEHYDLLILPPKLFIDCKIGKSIIRTCKDLSRERIQELSKSGSGIDAFYLHRDIESLESLEVKELYHFRELRKFLKWVRIRIRLRRFKIGGVNVYEMMVGNWRKLEESVGR
jgi:hypothetical protein